MILILSPPPAAATTPTDTSKLPAAMRKERVKDGKDYDETMFDVFVSTMAPSVISGGAN